MSEIKPGSKVRVEIDGTVENVTEWDYKIDDPEGMCNNHYGFLKVVDQFGRYHYIWHDLYLPSRNVLEVTAPADPANWPPTPGEVWEADGNLWMVRQCYTDPDEVMVVAAHGYNCEIYSYSTNRLGEFRALNPKRVYPNS